MKVKSSIKKLCSACYIVKYNKKYYVKCNQNPRHKQRQRFSTTKYISTPSLMYPTAYQLQRKSIESLLSLIL